MKFYKILITFFCVLLIPIYSFAHGGNITGWKDKDSDKIVLHDGKYYGYHNEDGQRHYHQVEWDEEKQRWVIVAPAVYYDENFNVLSNNNDNNSEKIEVKFADTVDGDTAKFIMNGEEITVRFLGIDTPETVKPNTPVQPYGPEASDFTKTKLTNASKIELEFDENSDPKDKYDRYLAWVWVDGELLQNLIIKEGLAQTYMLQNNYMYAGLLQTSEYEAKNSKIGIWSDDANSNTDSNTTSDTSSNVTNTTDTNAVNSNNISTATSDTTTLGAIIIAIVVFILTSLKIIKRKK